LIRVGSASRAGLIWVLEAIFGPFKMKKNVLALLVLCTISACASVYRQPGIKSNSPMEMSVIEDEPCPSTQCLIILKIDGKRRGPGWLRRYELLPGLRTIEFAFFGLGANGPHMTNTYSTSNIIVEFEARPGAIYLMRSNSDRDSLRWQPEIIEKTSGTVVSRQLTPSMR
jgi:hypothetical protein